MIASTLSRAERRRLQHVRSPALGWLTLGDERFFASNPTRRHRVRLPGPAEIDTVTEVDVPALLRSMPDHRLAVVVRMIAPGSMVRAIFPALKGGDLDFSEAEAALAFDIVTARATGSLDLIVRALAEEAGKAGGPAR